MTASDVSHKAVLNLGGTLKPSAKAIHGDTTEAHALDPLHRKSRSGPDELDLCVSSFESA